MIYLSYDQLSSWPASNIKPQPKPWPGWHPSSIHPTQRGCLCFILVLTIHDLSSVMSVKPQCGNCTQFGIGCDFSPLLPQPLGSTSSGSGPSRRGRPRSDWDSWTHQVQTNAIALSTSSAERSNDVFNIDHLELFHNHMLRTADTMHDGTQTQRGLWSEGFPQLGFQHSCIMALILSLSSYHLVKLNPNNAAGYLALAEKHSTAALGTATVLFSSLCHDNAPAVYVTSILICYVAFAKGPGTGNFLFSSEDGSVPWLHLLRGVRLVVETSGWSSVFSGILAAYVPVPDDSTPGEPPIDPSMMSTGIEDWRSSLNDVADLIAVFTEIRYREAFRDQLKSLTDCFEKTFGKGQHARVDVVGKMDDIFAWTYNLCDTYVEALGQKDPVAMIILGHFCALLSMVERQFWCIQGWPSHTMNDILHKSEKCRKWLSWPLAFLEQQSSYMKSI